MSGVPISYILYEQSKKAERTDCTLIFKERSGGGSTKEVHTHRCVLSSVSPYFATHLKSTWKGDQPIVIETVEYSVFQGILKTIYLSEIEPLENLQYGLDLYEAAHFYQLHDVIDLVRDRLKQFCEKKKLLAISSLFKISLKYQDYALAEFLRVYFLNRPFELVYNEDFKNYPEASINMLYQIKGWALPKVYRFKALETYVKKNGIGCVPVLKPAIQAINFERIPLNMIKNTVLITEEEKKVLLVKKDNGHRLLQSLYFTAFLNY